MFFDQIFWIVMLGAGGTLEGQDDLHQDLLAGLSLPSGLHLTGTNIKPTSFGYFLSVPCVGLLLLLLLLFWFIFQATNRMLSMTLLSSSVRSF